MITYIKDYEVIVVGAGHAGCEAALVCARMGVDTLLLTMNLDSIAQMSCNPAIGGLAKGHLVKEIDALGGEMAKVTDKTALQVRMLNTKKGPAVWAPRAQSDKKAYQTEMKRVLEGQPRLDVKQAIVEKLLVDDNQIIGVQTLTGMEYLSKIVILTTGTFLNGLIHIGLEHFSAGRAGEFPAIGLSTSLKELGLELGRLKTGTPPRVNARTINFDVLEPQYGDEPPVPFSHFTKKLEQQQLPCYITYTNSATHKLILNNLDRSPLYSGKIVGRGPRYCPSIEDKVVRFADKERHQIFLEPEGRSTDEYYVNGMSTSLPEDVQLAMLRTVRGLEEVEIMRPGYAIEYDFVFPTQIYPWLETKSVKNLFLAGQINGTSGYEEAAAQGLMAGINAVLKLKNERPFILHRYEAYIGVLIDDLVTKSTTEPYRMFTSRAEYRLLLRQDNADSRLMKYGNKFGLISDEAYNELLEREKQIENEITRLEHTQIHPPQINPLLKKLGTTELSESTTLSQILRRPEVSYSDLSAAVPSINRLPTKVSRQVEIRVKYQGYIVRQLEQISKCKKMETWQIPHHFDYSQLRGIRKEAIEKWQKIKPQSVGQASRISGVSPADVSILLVYLTRLKKGTNYDTIQNNK